MNVPKFELKCKSDGGTKIVFTLKNISSLIVSNIKSEIFKLLYFDGTADILYKTEIKMPTSLGPNEEKIFTLNHPFFKERRIGSEKFEFAFIAEDEWSNEYCCVATKDVDDPQNTYFIIGQWVVDVSKRSTENNMEIEKVKETKIFISHRSIDVDYATAVVDFLEDLGVQARSIVCTSVPDHLIPNGQRIYDWLRSQFQEYNLHMIFLLSDNYYNSPDCLNEMGAAWVTKADSDVILLPGFGPEKIRGCIGSDIMAIDCGGNNEILEDRIKQLQGKVCKEFKLNPPNDRRWTKIKEEVIRKLREKEPEIEEDIRQQEQKQPVFDLKILELNQQIPGSSEIINLWNGEPRPKHRNVRFQIELCNSVIIRNMKVLGICIEKGIVKRNKAFTFSVCYMESPDTKWNTLVHVLSRDTFPAGEDGIPKIVPIEYWIDNNKYYQVFSLDENGERAYYPGEQKAVAPKSYVEEELR